MWCVEDGYAGGDRPLYTEVDDEELAECETEQDREDLIEEVIKEDFLQRISWRVIRTES